MGRELQKKKNKSSIPKKRQKAPSKKKLLQNPIIAKHWNQKETLAQNYRRLGLTSRLNHATGGTEKSIAILGLNEPGSSRTATSASSTAAALNIVSKAPAQINISEIEVERDPTTGAILRITGDENAGKKPNPLNDLLNELDDSDDDKAGRGNEWDGFAMVPARREGEAENDVVRELEDAAANGVRKAPRTQSTREQEWLERLVGRYGEDYERMARDRKLNPMQQTAADIRKRVRKWKGSAGKE